MFQNRHIHVWHSRLLGVGTERQRLAAVYIRIFLSHFLYTNIFFFFSREGDQKELNPSMEELAWHLGCCAWGSSARS